MLRRRNLFVSTNLRPTRIRHWTGTIGGGSGHDRWLILENHVDIGAHAQILGPITLGHNSVIGAGAIVVKNVPPYAVVVGNPAI